MQLTFYPPPKGLLNVVKCFFEFDFTRGTDWIDYKKFYPMAHSGIVFQYKGRWNIKYQLNPLQKYLPYTQESDWADLLTTPIAFLQYPLLLHHYFAFCRRHAYQSLR